MKGIIPTASGIVSSEWIDSNGHMNVTAYMTLFDQGTEMLLHKFEFVVTEANSDFAVVMGKIFIEHRKELLEGEELELWSGFVAIRPSFITLTHRLRSDFSLRAVCDMQGTALIKKREKVQT